VPQLADSRERHGNAVPFAEMDHSLVLVADQGFHRMVPLVSPVGAGWVMESCGNVPPQLFAIVVSTQ
jgi:hypothetical protein